MKKIFGVLLGVSLFLYLIVLNAIETVLFVTVRPFSRALFTQWNNTLAGSYWALCSNIVPRLFGLKYEFTGEFPGSTENAILVANHQSMVDVMAVWQIGYRAHRTHDIKFFAKESLKHIPGIGWGAQFTNQVFLARNWNEDAARIERTFSKFKKRNIPLLLVSFPEGTRATPSKLKASHEYARQHGLPVTEKLLIPRTKGFVSMLHGLADYCDAVYDLTIVYEGRVPSLYHYFTGFTPVIRVHSEKFSIRSLPPTDAGRGAWLMERFREKDRRLTQTRELFTSSTLR